jgi:hypothetical protein
MTETEWVACTEPWRMLEFAQGKVGDRKFWLFSCACFRRCQEGRTEPQFIDITEAHADRKAAGRLELERLLRTIGSGYALGASDPFFFALLGHDVAAQDYQGQPEQQAVECSQQAELLRDIFGPFSFHCVRPDQTWLTATVVSIAQAIYDDRAFDRLPIVADALEEAGCTNADILGHCRSPGPHVRGCWVVDLLLGKE